MIERCALCGGLLTQRFYITFDSTGDKVCEMCIAQKMKERREKYGESSGSSD